MVMDSRSERRRLALVGKLDLMPAYAVMLFMLLLSYASSMAYSYPGGGEIVTALCEFGIRHIPAVREGANLSKYSNAYVFVMTVQWLVSVLYLLVFCVFLSPFSKSVRVAVDKAMQRVAESPNEDKAEFSRIIFLVLVPLVFLGDIRLIPIPTFLNGGLFATKGGGGLIVYLINSTVLMPAFSWLVVLATFLFYWSWIYMVANYKAIFNM